MQTTSSFAVHLVSSVPERFIRAIEDLLEAMDESEVTTLVAEVREILDDRDEGGWSPYKKPFRRLDCLSAWIAEFRAAWGRADEDWTAMLLLLEDLSRSEHLPATPDA